MADKFIQSAIRHPGALTRKAERAGKSIREFCASGHHDTETVRQCNFAKTLKHLRPKGRAAHRAALKGARTRARHRGRRT